MQDGWWYVMPAPGGGGYLVFMTDFDHLPQDRATRSSWLEAQFLQAGPIRDGSNCLPDFAAHKAMDARSSRASRFVDAGLVVLGDAAWSNDPLSGRGITMAIDQARRLSQALCEALSGGLGVEALRSYSDWCDSTYARSERARLQAYAAAGAQTKGPGVKPGPGVERGM